MVGSHRIKNEDDRPLAKSLKRGILRRKHRVWLGCGGKLVGLTRRAGQREFDIPN